MKSYKVEDNFLSEGDFLPIKNMLLSHDCAWYHQGAVSGVDEDKEMLDTYFSHTFFSSARDGWGDPRGISSNLYDLLLPLVRQLEVDALIRLRANNYPHTQKRTQHTFHIDNDYPHKTAILYINTNNGMTILEDGTKINSIENRLLTFNGLIKHSSTTCTDSRSRVVVNVNYIKEK
tara:strand:- start:753 stop:1280 length:528 start_codon:yes stop_codon:yes gene_type:complete